MSQPPLIWTRRRALGMIGGLAGGLALHACTASPDSASSDTASDSAVTDGSSTEPVSASTGSTLWIGYTPLYIAEAKGFFEENGLDYTYRVFSGSSEADAAYASGRIQGQANVTSEAVALAAQGLDYRVIQVADSSLGGDGILAADSIKDIADFKGKQVAVEVGGVSHFFLLQVLEEAGLTADDVSLQNVTPDAAAAAYQSKNVDIAVTYSPFLKQASDARADGRIIYDTSQMPTAIVDVYLFDPEFAQSNPGAMEAYIKSIFMGIEFLETNPDEALKIAGERLELSPEDVASELKGVDLTSLEKNVEMLGNPDSDIYLVKHMDSLGEFLVNQGQISEAPANLDQLLMPEYVENVQNNA